MSVSIVIPNYNGEELLITNLPQTIKILQEFANVHNLDIELVINDDGSQDRSREILKTYEAKGKEGRILFTILYNEKNYGFSTTVNRGVKKANGEIVVLLNNDVIPDKGFLEPLLKHFSDEKMFAVGCMDKSVEGDHIVLRGRGLGQWQRGFLVHSKGEVDGGNTTLWVSGGSGAFRKAIWEKLGGLNELMNPFYWEDIDLSYRALKAGYKILFEKESTVIHKHEEGIIKKTVPPRRVRVASYRNQFYFVWINADTANLLNHVLWLPYHKVKALMRGDGAFFQGGLQALAHLPDVLGKRLSLRKIAKVSDAEVIRALL